MRQDAWQERKCRLTQGKERRGRKKTYEEAFTDTFKAIVDEKAEQENQKIVQVRLLARLGLVVSSFTHKLKESKDIAIEVKGY